MELKPSCLMHKGESVPGRFPLKCAGVNPVSSSVVEGSFLCKEHRGEGMGLTTRLPLRRGGGGSLGRRLSRHGGFSTASTLALLQELPRRLGEALQTLITHTPDSRLNQSNQYSLQDTVVHFSPRIRATCQELSVSPSFYPETELIGLSLSSSQQRFSSRTQAPSPAV